MSRQQGWATMLVQGTVMAVTAASEASVQCTPASILDSLGPNDFGRTVATDGVRVAVGDPESDSVATFVWDAGVWAAETTIDAPVAESYFGWSLQLHGPRLVIGAPEAFEHNGRVYVYEYDDGWRLAHELGGDSEPFDRFGFSVDAFGDRVIVGARGEDCKSESTVGAAHVLALVDGRWVQEAHLFAREPEHLQAFGFAVTISDQFVAIGAPGDFVSLYRMESGEWRFERDVLPPTSGSFGNALDLQGGTLLIGDTNHSNSGAAYAYQIDSDDEPVQLAVPQGVRTWLLGMSLHLAENGHLAIVGDPLADVGYGLVGAAIVYSREPDRWSPINVLADRAAEPGDFVGRSVCANGTIAALGSPRSSETAGYALVFEYPSAPSCRAADLDGDGSVSVSDLLILLTSWGECERECPPPCAGDIEPTCGVDAADLLAMLMDWG